MSFTEHTPILCKIKAWRGVMDVFSESNCTGVEKYSSCNRGFAALKTLFFGYVKYRITFSFPYNGILSGIMKGNFLGGF